MTQRAPDHQKIMDEAWSLVIGHVNWLQSVLFGEFADHRPLSSVVADMLLSFLPGVVIVTSARDAVAVVLRLANHPEKREELMEWVLLSACLVVIALPLAMAAGGAAFAGVGAIVGGIAGSGLGAALRAVMLMLIKEATKLADLVHFLQKFIIGDILKFLRAIKFAQYEKPLLLALNKVAGKLVDIVNTLRTHLESLHYFDTVKATIAKLAEWEKKFYAVQQDALKQIPKALVELDARLAKVLVQTVPKEAHTVTTGVQVDKTAAAVPAKQRVEDTPGKVMPKVGDKDEAAGTTSTHVTKPKPAAKAQPKKPLGTPIKNSPDPVKLPDAGTNTKMQTVADAAVAVDRELITKLSTEASTAEKNGDKALAAAKIEQARSVLRPHLPKNPGDNWNEIIKRLDVSSPKDGAVFWSGDPKAAQKFAENINGTTLETTAGGKIIDGWDEVNKGYAWDARYGSPPYGRDLWSGVSKKYAEGVTGYVNAVQTPGKLWDSGTLWHNVEKPIFQDKLLTGEIKGVSMYTINNSGEFIPLSKNYVNSLLRLKGDAP
jgi:hypothetical protein